MLITVLKRAFSFSNDKYFTGDSKRLTGKYGTNNKRKAQQKLE